MGEMSMEQVLEIAISREVAANAMYTDLAGRIGDANARDALLFMAREEGQHRDFLRDYQSGKVAAGAIGLREAIDARVVETLGAPDWASTRKPEEVFLIAARKEGEACEFYRKLAEVHPHGEIRDLLLRLSKEELGHKEKMEYLFANTAFPQTDGG
jgi:rubrerythrin